MQGLSPFPRSEPVANCMQYASHHMVSWSVVSHLGKLVSMAIGNDTEIKQYQVQKRFSLADIALLRALGSLPFPAFYMPLRHIAGVKGTLKVCESDVNHLGIDETLLVYSIVENWDVVMTWAARESSRLFGHGGGVCGKFTWRPRGNCLVPRLRIVD